MNRQGRKPGTELVREVASRARQAENRSGGLDFAEVRRWVRQFDVPSADALDWIALEIGDGYVEGRYDYGFCDVLLRVLVQEGTGGSPLTVPNGQYSRSFFEDVYLIFGCSVPSSSYETEEADFRRAISIAFARLVAAPQESWLD